MRQSYIEIDYRAKRIAFFLQMWWWMWAKWHEDLL